MIISLSIISVIYIVLYSEKVLQQTFYIIIREKPCIKDCFSMKKDYIAYNTEISIKLFYKRHI